MNNLTFVVPVGIYHQEIAQRAIDSVKAQTVPCEIVVIHDHNSQGAGWARNQGLAQASSPWISFLDSDDTIDPRFAEICLGILEQYSQSHTDPRYVYTDWLGVENVAFKAPAPCDAWTNKTFHLVTTVLPTERVRLIGGFDEQLQGAEDADFYVRLRLSGVCGLHVNAPLVHYREGGQRSITARENGQEAYAQQYMTNRYGRIPMMGCCGDPTPGPLMPEGEPNEGDVLVQAQWAGNMQKRGLSTGTIYARTSYPKMLYVNAADAEKSPHLFKRMQSPMQAANGVILKPQYKAGEVAWQDTIGALFGGGQAQPAIQPIEYRPNVAGRSKTDTLKKAQEWTRVEENLE